MLSKGEKIFTIITNLLTFALCLLVAIPFGKTGVSEKELFIILCLHYIIWICYFNFSLFCDFNDQNRCYFRR